MADTPPVALGLDVGGHGVKAALVDAHGAIVHFEKRSIDSIGERAVQAVEDRIAELVDVLDASAAELGAAGRLPVGVGIPGFHDRRSGLLRSSPNFPGWEDVPVGQRLAARLDRPAATCNDANAAVLGEAWAGAAAGLDHVLMLTLGTGVGSGILVGGHLVRGHAGAGAEAGHLALYPGGRKCGCGGRGCLEQYASGPGLVATAEEAWFEEGQTGDLPATTAREVFEAEAQAGVRPDFWASRAIERWCLDLAMGIASLVHVLSPEAIVIGGGMVGAWDRIAEPIETALRKRANPAILGDALPLRRAELGEAAGAVGAAAAALGRGG
jgi:glucokinase